MKRYLGAFPPVDFRAVCLVRAIAQLSEREALPVAIGAEATKKNRTLLNVGVPRWETQQAKSDT